MNKYDIENVLNFDLFMDNDSENDDEDIIDLTEDIPILDDDKTEELLKNELAFDNSKVYSNISFHKLNIQSLKDYENQNLLRLTMEEDVIIKTCNDVQLKRLLVLNRFKNQQLRELYKEIHDLYKDCMKNISDIQEELNCAHTCKDVIPARAMSRTHIWKIGTPYFKDNSYFSPPPNLDVIAKKTANEYWMPPFYENPRWTPYDQAALRVAILQMYSDYKQTKLENEISFLKTELKDENDESKLEIAQLQLNELLSRDSHEIPPLDPNLKLDWNKISQDALKNRHSAIECKAFWNIFLHPSINKTEFTSDENTKIIALAKSHGHQNWDEIAKLLNTNRSGYLICLHYFSRLCDKFKRDRFLPNEDKFLLDVIRICRLGDYIPWSKVARHFDNRSKYQLYHRYKYYLAYTNTRKGRFTEAENIFLLHLVERFGKDFGRIVEYFPNRTSVQLRNRYSNYLDKNYVQLGNFTPENDKRIMEFAEENGLKKWSELAKELNRARAHVRQRYLTVKKFVGDTSDMKVLQNVPRRKQDQLLRRQLEANKLTAKILETLKLYDRIPQLKDVKQLLRAERGEETIQERKIRESLLKKKRIPSRIDKGLLFFFKGATSWSGMQNNLLAEDVIESAHRIIKLLTILGVNLASLNDADGEHMLLSNREKTILQYIKKTVNGQQCTAFSTSLSGELLPPMTGTLLGLRCLIIKYDLYKNENKNYAGYHQWSERGLLASDNPPWKVQQNLIQLDTQTKTLMEYERSVFFKRLHTLFKWPAILSLRFPNTMNRIKDETNTEVKIVSPRGPGRPRKQMNPKIMKMKEAWKKIREKKQDTVEMEYNEECQFDSEDSMSETEDYHHSIDVNDISKESTSGIPLYSSTSVNKRAARESPDSSPVLIPFNNRNIRDAKAQVRPPTGDKSSKVGSLRVINLKDLQLLHCPAVPLIRKDDVMKLTNAATNNKIVVLDSWQKDVGEDSNEGASRNERLNVTEVLDDCDSSVPSSSLECEYKFVDDSYCDAKLMEGFGDDSMDYNLGQQPTKKFKCEDE